MTDYTTDNPLLRVRSLNGRAQVFVRIDGRDHEIGGIMVVKIDEIQPSEMLTVQIAARLGGLGAE
jgi:hypothetical protein